MTPKPILIVKFPINFIANGKSIYVFSDLNSANNIEENFKSKLEGDYHVLLTPTNKEVISFEVLNLKDDLTPLDFKELKKAVLESVIKNASN